MFGITDLGTYLLGKPAPEPKLSPMFIALHVFANLLGDALFLLAGGAAALYLLVRIGARADEGEGPRT